MKVLSLLGLASVAALAAPPFNLPSVAEKVGYFKFNSPDGASICNISIVGESLALTNTHCVPTPLACETGVAYFFDRTGEPTASYRCKKILHAGVYNSNQTEPFQDFAILELEGTPGFDIGYLELAPSSGLDPNSFQPVWRVKVNPPTVGERRVRLDYAQCQGSLRGPSGKQYLHMEGTVSESCQVYRGNSGGPVLNAKGQIIGLTARIELGAGTSIPDFNDFNSKNAQGPAVELIGPVLKRF